MNELKFTNEKNYKSKMATGLMSALFAIMLLLSICQANAQSQFTSMSLNGPTTVAIGREETYTYRFAIRYGHYYSFQSAELRIVGGVFVTGPSTTSTRITINTNTTHFIKVIWQQSGSLTVIDYLTSPSFNTTASSTMHVKALPAIPDVGLTFNGTPTNLSRSTSYTATATGATYYEWTTSGDVSVVSQSGGNATIQTGAGFTTGSVSVRGRNFADWSPWKTIQLTFPCPTPTVTKITGSNDADHIYRENTSYKFSAFANGSGYDWMVEQGNATINYSNYFSNVLDLKLNADFNYVRISVRSYNNCGWSPRVYYDIYEYKSPCESCPAAPNLTLKQNFAVQQNVLCYSSDIPMIVEGPQADYYDWTVTGSGYNCVYPNGTQYCQPYGATYRTTSNFINLATEGSSYFHGTSVSVQVTAYYCNGCKAVYRAKTYTLRGSSCGLGFRLGEDEESDELQKPYPNPVKSGEKVSVTLSEEDRNATITVTDLLGNKIQTLKNITEEKIAVSTEGWKTGVYILSIAGKSKVKTLKIQVE